LQAGGSPAATPFLCFAKEEEAKKGDRASLPCGLPSVQIKKREKFETRCAQTTNLSYPFSAPHKRQLKSGIPKSKTKPVT
jgi:hypothetical protein